MAPAYEKDAVGRAVHHGGNIVFGALLSSLLANISYWIAVADLPDFMQPFFKWTCVAIPALIAVLIAGVFVYGGIANWMKPTEVLRKKALGE